MESISQLNWTGDQDLIFRGFRVICDGVQAVVIMWTESKIRTMRFTNIHNAVYNKSPFVKQYEYKFSDQDQSPIRTIVSTSSNTFALNEDGRIFYFYSFKNIEFIPNQRAVRAICKSDLGFVTIRNMNELDILLEFYSDRNSSGMLKKVKKISVSWEGNTQFTRTEEKSCLALDQIDSEIKQQFYGNISPEHSTDLTRIVLFSVNNSLNCIFYENTKNANSEVIPITSFLIDIMEIFCILDYIFVLLESGVIQYLELTKSGELETHSIFLGLNEVQAYEIDLEKNIIYLADENSCLQIQILQSNDKGIEWKISKLALPGIVAIALLPIIDSILFLTLNNFVYAYNSHSFEDEFVGSQITKETQLTTFKEQANSVAENENLILEEASKINAINLMENKEFITSNCHIEIIIKSRDEYGDHPALVDKNQIYDIFLIFHYSKEIEDFLSLNWTLEITAKSVKTYSESIKIDAKFLERKRIKLFNGLQRDNAFIGSEFSGTLSYFVNTHNSASFLIKLNLPINYYIDSVFQHTDVIVPKSEEFGFKIKFRDTETMKRCFQCISLNVPDFGIRSVAVGREIISLNVEDDGLVILSSDCFIAIHLLKKYLIMESFKKDLWKRMEFENRENLTLCDLSARHLLIQDSFEDYNCIEIYRDLRNVVINLL